MRTRCHPRFNERGFDALDPKWSGGRPRTISDEVRERICLIARTSPADWKITAFSTWSLSKLAEQLVKWKVIPSISRETLRRILRAGKVSWKTTTTWKASTDPELIAKMRRVLALYDTPPTDGQVICVDEFGPLNLMPRKGKAWGGRYGVRAGCGPPTTATAVRDTCSPPSIWPPAGCTTASAHVSGGASSWPGQKLYVVLDNFSPHKHAKVRAWAADNDVELVFLPTYGSWLNWIESEFAAVRYFALNGTDHRCHDEQNAAIASYVRWRNARTKLKTNFVPDSPIRSWTDYPARAACRTPTIFA
ncbi:helix-turn-helix domain-containing protein [Streptomyces sviceus]|uniref:helix-turn-helix domain-containing protein n=1 Tax=Streptomyces sviceus TaxID=285530 RepID=UPI0036B1650A